MGFVWLRWFLVGTILLISISEINGREIHRRRRQANTNVDLDVILNDVQNIPGIGRYLYQGIKNVNDAVDKVNKITNGALSRIVNSYPPCTINYKGIVCDGEAKNGGIPGITRELINDTELPEVVKKVMIDILDEMVFPLFDSIAAGRNPMGEDK